MVVARCTTLTQEAITETFEDTKNLIHKTCHDFISANGGNYEDAFSLAQQIFFEVYERYDEHKGTLFSTYLRQVIWWRLMDSYRSAKYRSTNLPRVPVELETIKVDTTHEFDLQDFCDRVGLGKDARTVCDLVAKRPEVPGRTRAGKKALKKILTKEFGWSIHRCDRTFRQISQSLELV